MIEKVGVIAIRSCDKYSKASLEVQGYRISFSKRRGIYKEIDTPADTEIRNILGLIEICSLYLYRCITISYKYMTGTSEVIAIEKLVRKEASKRGCC